MAHTFEEPIIERVDDFLVLRDDLYRGGTKGKVLEKLLNDVPQNEIVYAGHAHGYAAFALACACERHGKTATVFFSHNDGSMPEPLKLALAHPNMNAIFVDGDMPQAKLYDVAAAYARESDERHIYPVGFCTPEFERMLIAYIKSVPASPKEVWTLAGSGFLARSLVKAWPDAEINAVNMGFPHVNTTGLTRVFNTLEDPEEKAVIPPPYPSASYYDAKVWRVAKEHGTPGALIWNVA